MKSGLQDFRADQKWLEYYCWLCSRLTENGCLRMAPERV
ncbi:MAG: MmcB family DNA repair protein [Alphaproteobacteria bacterium]|nr:MmcB family DNA repair protein [Alphaproteobacteria bacterium]